MSPVSKKWAKRILTGLLQRGLPSSGYCIVGPVGFNNSDRENCWPPRAGQPCISMLMKDWMIPVESLEGRCSALDRALRRTQRTEHVFVFLK